MVLFGRGGGGGGRGDGGRRGGDAPRGRPPESSAERHARILAYTGEDQGSGDSGGSGCLGCAILLVFFALLWVVLMVIF